MRITIELRRPARRTAIVLLAIALLAVPGAVLANHQFFDVPTGHPFHGDIDAVAGAGIAAGFGDGGFHPSEAVTRQAMAAFLHRGLGRAAYAGLATPMSANVPLAAGEGFSPSAVPVRQVTITVPGATNAFSPLQLVYVSGDVSFYDTMSIAADGCPCGFEAIISGAPYSGQASQWTTFESTTTQTSGHTIHVEGVFTRPPGAHTFVLYAYLLNRASTTNATSFDLHGRSSLTALTFPFDQDGGQPSF